MNSRTFDGHMSDDVLVRVLDGDATPAEKPDAQAHLDACTVCADRFATLQRRTQTLTALLTAADPAMPALRPPAMPPAPAIRVRAARPWLKAAAVLLLVAGVIASPARGHLAGWISSLAGRPDVQETDTAVPAAIGDPAGIEFEYAGSDLLVEFTDAGAGTRIRFSAHARGTVAASVQEPATSADLMVLPGGLRISSSDDQAVYVISLPMAVARVHVRVGDGPAVVIPAGALPCVIAIGGGSSVSPCTPP